MPSTRRWSVPPKRIAATAVLGVIGIFLVCGSVGMGAWLVGAIGVAVIAVGAGIFVLSVLDSRATSMIEGTGHVLSVSAAPSGATHGRCRLHLALNGKGIEKIAVRIRDAAVPVEKWPDVGADLPVMIMIDKPQRTRVLWADVATHRERAEERARAQEAAEQAGAMAAEDDDYANLDAALDGLDNLDDDVVDASPAEPPITESGVSAPPWTDRPVGDPIGSESNRAGGEPAMAASGTRTIEMDVIDPSVMRWTGPPPRRPYGSRPSPFPRRRPERNGASEAPPDETGPAEPAPAEAAAAEPTPAEPTPAEPAPAEPPPAEPAPSEPADSETGPDEAAAAEAGAVAVAPVDNDISAVAPDIAEAPNMAATPAPPPAPASTAIESGLMVDNGRIVAFDLLRSASAAGPGTAGASRSALPDWPPRSAAAAAAAAALPHQWDHDDHDDHDDRTAAVDAVEAVSEVAASADTPADATRDTIGDEIGDGDPGYGPQRVPRNRPAPADEVFDQETPDDGPGYSPDAEYADDTGYDEDAGYNSDARYAGPRP
jgi:hypothetical protein